MNVNIHANLLARAAVRRREIEELRRHQQMKRAERESQLEPLRQAFQTCGLAAPTKITVSYLDKFNDLNKTAKWPKYSGNKEKKIETAVQAIRANPQYAWKLPGAQESE